MKKQLAERLRSFTREAYGERGSEHLASLIGIPTGTVINYEKGCTMPAEVLLAIIEVTGIHPIWLLSGRGPQYLWRSRNVEDERESRVSAVDSI
jgi:hypothetical protein